MGVKDLWTVVSSVREECSLHDLAGKRIAVDLSGWIFAVAKGMPATVNKPHLRNLFYRVRSLLRAGVELVVVLDGPATQLKQATLEKRGSQRAQSGMSQNGPITRPLLDDLGKECRGLLDALGVPCLQSRSEAEALCALLNSSGIVDGVITEDSDVFLYGATVVYRNLSVEQRVQQVSCYRMSRIHSELGLSRSALVSLALLLGCDYCPGGVPRVGKESALKLLHSCQEADPECDLLQRLRGWREEGGDVLCPVEDQIRRKARKVPGFPSEQVIREFLEFHDTLPDPSVLHWRMPQMSQLELTQALVQLAFPYLQSFCSEHMHWSKKLTNQRAVDVVTQWVLRVRQREEAAGITAQCIVKQMTKNWVRHYEVQWVSTVGTAGGRRGSSTMRRPSPFVTCEVAAQFDRAYSQLTSSFNRKMEEERAEKLQKRQSRKRKSSTSTKQTKLEFPVKKQRNSVHLNSSVHRQTYCESDCSVRHTDMELEHPDAVIDLTR